jgi:predicted GIY-YIG superfamily endonuclease
MLFGNRKKKARKGGWVYVGESTRKDGSKKLYTGMTRRSPSKRWGEHMDNVKKKNSRTWTGKGKFFRPVGALWSSNPAKAEKTIKKMSPAKKRALGRLGAKRYKKKRGFFR